MSPPHWLQSTPWEATFIFHPFFFAPSSFCFFPTRLGAEVYAMLLLQHRTCVSRPAKSDSHMQLAHCSKWWLPCLMYARPTGRPDLIMGRMCRQGDHYSLGCHGYRYQNRLTMSTIVYIVFTVQGLKWASRSNGLSEVSGSRFRFQHVICIYVYVIISCNFD